ncbi:MAG: zincin-like metallopeptidase domain-containing protein [Oscillospiraceae bacterium]|nr:zincin-like metallopeptidase domain-containing protein [Oscillospiraceae bacterium]
MNVYDIVTDRIVKRLEEAEQTGEKFYWIKPFAIGAVSYPCCYETGEPYRGINRLLLEPDEYTTFSKTQEHNQKYPDNPLAIRKGAKANIALYFNYKEIKDEDGKIMCDKKGNPIKKPYMRYYTLFSRQDILNKHGDNIPSKFPIQKFSHDEINEITQDELLRFGKMVNSYCRHNGIDLQIVSDGTQCYYSPSDNVIRVPVIACFNSVYEYISGVSHELCHSTGKVLGRFGDSPQSTEQYAFEELVAEIGAEMLISHFKIEDDRSHKENDLGYLQSWSKYLKENTKQIVFAAQKAQKAVEFITEHLNLEETLDDKIAAARMNVGSKEKSLLDYVEEER